MSQETSKPKALINPPVFFGSAFLILGFVLFGSIFPKLSSEVFSAIQSWIVDTVGWFYILAVATYLIFVVLLAISNLGTIKLGPDHSEPEYSYTSWFAMLFSAGMGIGLMFFGVAEPVMHYAKPPVGDPNTVAAAKQAMEITFFHWGMHAWAIYAIVALALAYFSFRHGLPLTIRSALYPLIGEKIHGPIGHTVDIFAVLGTMFGVATSLGLGVMQVNAGLNYLLGIPVDYTVQLILIAIITGFATTSVVLGLDGGIKRISEINLYLALTFLLFILAVGPTVYLLQTFVQNTGSYLGDIVSKTFELYAYEKTDWIGGWTLFYWGWWIAWSPFVGMFIARISKGRTIREFTIGVLFVPVGFTFAWMGFFGNSALNIIMNVTGGHALEAEVAKNVPVALFEFLQYFPLSSISSVLAVILIITFFVTSSDSGSLVIDMITSGGKGESPVWQRFFWAITEGVVAAVLLVAGGLTALQTASIASALPFAIVLLFVCYGLYKALRLETIKKVNIKQHLSGIQYAQAQVSWKQRLKTIIRYPKKEKVLTFLSNEVDEAMKELSEAFNSEGIKTNLEADEISRSIKVVVGEDVEFLYKVKMRSYKIPTFTYIEKEKKEDDEREGYYTAEVYLLEGGQNYDIMGYSKEQVIADVLNQYDKHMYFLNNNKGVEQHLHTSTY